MNIQSIGFNSTFHSDYSVKRNGLTCSYMVILMKSSAIFVIDGKEQLAEKDTVIVFDKNSVQDYRVDNGILICDWICIDADKDNDYIDSLEIPTNTLIKYIDSVFFSELIKNIASEFYSVNPRRSKMIDSLLRTLMTKISDASDSYTISHQNVDPHYALLIELRERIYRNPQLKWNVDSMATEVNMSRSYFQHIYREIFGVSCISDVISAKIEKAKEILSETSCTISQISFMCGYDNEEHFMRQFKKIVGVTPTAYRKATSFN